MIDHVPDVVELLGLDRGGPGRVCRVERVDPLPSRPTARTLCDWVPSVRMSPPTLALEFLIASSTCCIVTPYCFSEPGVEQDLVLLDRAAVARHVDHAGNLLERALSTQSCTALSWFRRVAGSLEDIADDLARRAPGREAGCHARGRLLEPIRLMTSWRAAQ